MTDTDRIVDPDNPASILEAKEEDRDRSLEDFSTAVGRLLQWFIDADNLSLSRIGFRVLIATHKLRPDLIGGMSFEEVSRKCGFGRSAAHKLSRELESIFQLHGVHDRSQVARAKYRKARRRTLGLAGAAS